MGAYACLSHCIYVCVAADTTGGAGVREPRYLPLSILSLLAKVQDVLPCSPEDHNGSVLSSLSSHID